MHVATAAKTSLIRLHTFGQTPPLVFAAPDQVFIGLGSFQGAWVTNSRFQSIVLVGTLTIRNGTT